MGIVLVQGMETEGTLGRGSCGNRAVSKGCCSSSNRDPCFLTIIRLDQIVRIQV